MTQGRPPRRRWLLGIGLMAYGAAGLVILAVLATGVIRGLDRIAALSASVEQERSSLSTALGTAAETIRTSSIAVSGVDASLGRTQAAVTSAATLATNVSVTMANLATALNVNILGSQPFAATSAGFTQAATELQTLSADLGTTADALGSTTADTQTVANDLARLVGAVDAVRAGLQSAPDTRVSDADIGTLRLVLAALLAWLAIQALAAVGFGLRLVIRRS